MTYDKVINTKTHYNDNHINKNHNYNNNKDGNDDNLQFLDDLSTTVDNNISDIKNKFKSKTLSVSSSSSYN